MRKIKILSTLLFILFLFSCTILIPANDYETIMDSVYNFVESKADAPLVFFADNWQSAAETRELGTGDCEDFAILMLKIVYETWGIKGSMIGLKCDYDRPNLDDDYHAIVLLDRYYDPSWGISFASIENDSFQKRYNPNDDRTWSITNEYSYDFVMLMTEGL